MKQTFKIRDQVILKSGGYYWNVNGYKLDHNGKETTIVNLSRYSEEKNQTYFDELEQDLLELLTAEKREQREDIKEALEYLKDYLENR